MTAQALKKRTRTALAARGETVGWAGMSSDAASQSPLHGLPPGVGWGRGEDCRTLVSAAGWA